MGDDTATGMGRARQKDVAMKRFRFLRALVGVGTIWGIALAGTSACTGETSLPPPPQGAVFEVRACKGSLQAPQGEVFRILLLDSTRIQAAAAALLATGEHIVAGTLRAGDGGFNAPWSWHMDPASVTFPDVVAEDCVGCPSFVQNDLSYWLQKGFYCAIGEVVTRDR